jgi:copper chaperone CopZ
VSLRKKEAAITFDPGRVDVEQMIEAVSHLGFRASLREPRPAQPDRNH